MNSLIMSIFGSVMKQGVVVSVVGYCIVFAALILLTVVYMTVPKLLKLGSNRQKYRTEKRTKGDGTVVEVSDGEVSGDESAAISAALYLFLNEARDEESAIVTIKRVSRNYSPWSSKIYGVRGFGK